MEGALLDQLEGDGKGPVLSIMVNICLFDGEAISALPEAHIEVEPGVM